MRKTYWNVSIVTVLFIFLLTPVTSNPLPYAIIDESMTPVPDSDTPLFLKSEEITFNISGEEEWGFLIVYAIGNFTISNPTNKSINQSIIFPFFENFVLSEFSGKVSFKILNLSIDETGIFYEYIEYKDYPSISFNISVEPYENQSFILEFITYSVTDSYGSYYKYIATTGKEWNHPIEHAYFKFIIDNSIFLGNLSGVEKFTRNETHTTGTIEHFNWTPEEDIEIRWTSHYDIDSDGDGVRDIDDEVPDDPDCTRDFDNDEICDEKDYDDDNDGIPDLYEIVFEFLDPYNPTDANEDYDNDKATNLEEYENMTEPDNAKSVPGKNGPDNNEDLLTNITIIAVVVTLFMVCALYLVLKMKKRDKH